jgi:Flp pilus assembly protein TadD
MKQSSWILGLFCVTATIGINCTAMAKTPIQATPRAVEHSNRGAALIDAGKLTEAEFQLKTALSLSPDYAEAYNNLGILYKKRGQLDLAIAQFEKASKLRKDYASPLSHLGAVYIAKGNYNRAIKMLRKAVNKDRTYVGGIHNLGLAFLLKAREQNPGKRKKLYKQAEHEFITATQLDPGFTESHLNLAELYVETGDLEKAEIRLRLAAQDRAHSPKIMKQLAHVLRLRGKGGDATKALQVAKATEDQQRAAAAYKAGLAAITEGEALKAAGKKRPADVAFQRALAAFKITLGVNKESLEAQYGTGVVYRHLGNTKMARKAWEATLKIIPTHPGALYNLGTLAFQEGQRSEGTIYFCDFLRVGRAFPQQAQVVVKHLQENKIQCPKS